MAMKVDRQSTATKLELLMVSPVAMEMETKMAAPTSFKLDEDLKSRVQQLANARRRSAHWLVREAIEQYVEREEKRESFKQDALQAWKEYQETGLHLTHEEADAWLARLEEGEDTEPPPCHT